MNVVLTGNEGFIGKNLEINLSIDKEINLFLINRKTTKSNIKKYLFICDVLIHTAGLNRSKKKNLFDKENYSFTKELIKFTDKNRKKKILFLSSSKFNEKTEYGISKKKAENFIKKNSKTLNYKYFIFRSPNVFGKWCRPNYNSFITTIFHNITRHIKIENISKKKKVELIYIDDLIYLIKKYLKGDYKSKVIRPNGKKINLNKLYEKISKIWKDYKNGIVNLTDGSFDKKIFSTMISYLPKKYYTNKILAHRDSRGEFFEFVKTKKSGQFSFFTINSNQIRGGHFHNSKNEKFIILSGKVLYSAVNLQNNSSYSKVLNSKNLDVINSIPGWKHTFKNLTKKKAIIAVWANEIFDSKAHDTYLI